MPKKEKPFVVPKTLGMCADLAYTLRQKRLDAQREVDKIAEQERELKEHIIRNLPKSNAEGITGKVACAKITLKQVPTVTDWDKFYKYLFRTKDPALLQKRIGEEAIKERWDAKKNVPGVEAFDVVTISLTKA